MLHAKGNNLKILEFWRGFRLIISKVKHLMCVGGGELHTSALIFGEVWSGCQTYDSDTSTSSST